MSGEEAKEAWERILPELPPAWDASDFDVGAGRAAQLRMAWREWERASGGTRRKYAELIALDRVREAAQEKTRSPLHIGTLHETETGWWTITVEAHHPDGWEHYADEYGPTLCDAAWAAIQAMPSTEEASDGS